MRVRLRRGFLGSGPCLALPALAWAQGYETLTLAEAAYLYSGLEVQEMLRASSLRQIPQVIMVCCTIWLVYRRVTSPRPQPIAGIVAYVVSCGLILVLFWPEAAPRFLTVRAVIPAGGVTSFIAVQNGMANVNARSSGLVPRQLLSGTGQAQVPQALDLILRAVTEMPLLLGDAIYPGLNRPFSRVGVLSEFVDQVETNPPASLRTRMPNFVEECYTPALEQLLKNKPEPTFEERMPWSSDMSGHLADIRIQGRRGVADDFGTAPTATPTTCRAFYRSMENETLQHLRGQRTAQGSNKARVVRDNLGITGREQARMFVAREMERQMETVHGPQRLVNAKRGLDVSSGLLSALSQFDLTAPFKSVGSQLEKHLDRMGRFLGVGSFLVYWGPYLVGHRHVRGAGVLPGGAAVVAVSGAALQAAGELLPAAHLRVLDAPVVGAGGRRRGGGLRQPSAGRLVRGAGGLGRGLHELHGGDGGRDHHGAASAGDPALRDLAGHRRHLARIGREIS